MSRQIVKVSQLVRYLKSKLDSDSAIQRILVQGEISNFKAQRSGHWYFSLKDETARISCVMFATYTARMKFLPKDGDKVIVQADISVYEAAGQMQMYVTAMKPDGLGDLFLQYEELKKKLSAEGLFEESHKKPIPKYPMRICLVTGNATAARKDVLSTLARRWPVASITEYPVLVQGDEAAGQIASALLSADAMDYDVILLVRGGGSIEDLWAFNDEALAHVIYQLKTPIITGVGHETDFTIADFVSDLRAPTPTGAAERCSPDILEVQAALLKYRQRLIVDERQALKLAAQRYQKAAQHPLFTSPQRLYSEQRMKLEYLSEKLDHYSRCTADARKRYENLARQFDRILSSVVKTQQNRVAQSRNRLVYAESSRLAKERTRVEQQRLMLTQTVATAAAQQKMRIANDSNLLDAYSPLKVLGRGYSIVEKDGQTVTDARTLQPNDRISIRMNQGSVSAEVLKAEGGPGNGGKEKDI